MKSFNMKFRRFGNAEKKCYLQEINCLLNICEANADNNI